MPMSLLFSKAKNSPKSSRKKQNDFETAINAKVAEIKEEMEANYATAIEEQVVTLRTELSERVDSYLEYVADEWIQREFTFRKKKD